MFNIVNICHSKLERIITRSLGKIGMMLRVNITNSSIIETSMVTDSSFRKTRVKQSNNIMCFSRNQLLLGGMLWFMNLKMLVFTTYIVELNISHMNLLMQ